LTGLDLAEGAIQRKALLAQSMLQQGVPPSRAVANA